MSKHFPLAVGQRVTVNATGTEGTIVDITFKVKFASTIYAWFYESDLIPHPPVEPLSYAIVSPPKGNPHATTGKIVARVGSHTPVLAPLVCVRLTSDARIGDVIGFRVHPETGAYEISIAKHPALAIERTEAIEAAARQIEKTFWENGSTANMNDDQLTALAALIEALAK